MYYICSDIHGEYNLFLKLLDKIKFSSSDKMFILGDIVDKGENSVELVKLIRKNRNIIATIGNHEQYFLNYYHGLMKDYCGGDCGYILNKLNNYFPKSHAKLNWDDVDFIEDLYYFVEEDNFVGVHAGLLLNENSVPLPFEKQNYNVMIFDRKFQKDYVIPKTDKPILFGHTPCNYKNGTGHFIKTLKNGKQGNSNTLKDYCKIQLDTGILYTNMAGCLCLETMEEFYVNK